MKIKIDRNQLIALCVALPSDNSKLTLVKDDGIYLMSFDEKLASKADSRTIAYARGFNPTTDGDIWQKCVDAVGGDDFGEFVGTRKDFEDILDKSEGDIIISVTASSISTSYIEKRTDAQKAARAKALTEWMAKVRAVGAPPASAWSPKMKRLVKKYEKELAELQADFAVKAKIEELLDKTIAAHPEHAAEMLAAKKRNAGVL